MTKSPKITVKKDMSSNDIHMCHYHDVQLIINENFNYTIRPPTLASLLVPQNPYILAPLPSHPSKPPLKNLHPSLPQPYLPTLPPRPHQSYLLGPPYRFCIVPITNGAVGKVCLINWPVTFSVIEILTYTSSPSAVIMSGLSRWWL